MPAGKFGLRLVQSEIGNRFRPRLPWLTSRALRSLLLLPLNRRRRRQCVVLLAGWFLCPSASVRESFRGPLPLRASHPEGLGHRPAALPRDDLEQGDGGGGGIASNSDLVQCLARARTERPIAIRVGMGTVAKRTNEALPEFIGDVAGGRKCLADSRVG